MTQCRQIVSADTRRSTLASNIAGATEVAWGESEEDLGRRGMAFLIRQSGQIGAARPRWPETSSVNGRSACPARGRPTGMSATGTPQGPDPLTAASLEPATSLPYL
jgi:hypothetical protein